MRGVAVASAMFLTCASAAAAQSDFSLVGSQALHGVTGLIEQASEFRLSRQVRFRIETTSDAGLRSASRAGLLDPYGHRRRIASTVDFYPMKDSGLHFSLGMRSRPRLGGMAAMSAVNAELKSRIDALPQMQQLRANDGIKRRMPVATIGWTEALGAKTAIRLDAGAMMIRMQKVDPTLMAVAYSGGSSGGNRIGATARLTLIGKF